MIRIFKPVFFVAIAILALCGFTFDYEVLAECERKHPNDFITRIACNNVEEERRKEVAALPCLDQAVKRLNDNKPALDKLLAENAEVDHQTLIANLEQYGFRPQTVASSKRKPNKELHTVVFTDKTSCNSKAYFLFNIHLDERKKVEQMRVWLKNYSGESETFLPYMSWNKVDNIKAIEDAYKRKAAEAILKAAQEKQLKQEIEKEKEKSNKIYWNFISTVVSILSTLLCFGLIWWITRNWSSFRNRFEALASSRYLRGFLIKENTSTNTVGDDDKIAKQSTRLNPTISLETQQRLSDNDERKQETPEPLRNRDNGNEAQTPKYPTSEQEKLDDDNFRNKYAFINVYVPLQYQSEFTKECEWYKQKVGVYPGTVEQENILAEISKTN